MRKMYDKPKWIESEHDELYYSKSHQLADRNCLKPILAECPCNLCSKMNYDCHIIKNFSQFLYSL